MNGYNFTEGVRRILSRAREEAVRLHHEYVGTEHILLGVLKSEERVAYSVLAHLDVDVGRMVSDIEQTITAGPESASTGPDLPYTTRAKRVLELAMTATRALDHPYVGSEHLLLGLIDEKTGVAAQVLAKAGVTHEAAQAKVLEMLGGPAPEPHDRTTATSFPARTAPSLVVVELRYDGGWNQRREFHNIQQASAFLASL